MLNSGQTIDIFFRYLTKFCSYRERSLYEVHQKIQKLGVTEEKIKKILISRLQEEHFINTWRFAKAYVNDKFRFNHWGKIKIAYELKKHRLDDELIRESLKQIEDTEYLKCLKELIRKKLEPMNHKLSLSEKRKKVYNYLLNKGYESELIRSQLEIL